MFAARENVRLKRLTNEETVCEYLSHPLLPERELVIARIGILLLGTRKLRYGVFNEVDPEHHPLPLLMIGEPDLVFSSEVCPIEVITTKGERFRTHPQCWSTLAR
jgi:hypothetical protein